jgi:uncharacterized protein YndB with AHSA1/START domain
MATITVSTEINAPIERVFAAFTDIEHGAEHVGAIKRIELMSPGPFNLGTKWVETREVLGRLDDAEMEVTSFERNRTYTLTHRKAGVRIDTAFHFEPVAGGTKVTIEFEPSNQGLPPGLLLPLEWAFAGKVRHALTDDLDDLKGTLEQVTRS